MSNVESLVELRVLLCAVEKNDDGILCVALNSAGEGDGDHFEVQVDVFGEDKGRYCVTTSFGVTLYNCLELVEWSGDAVYFQVDASSEKDFGFKRLRCVLDVTDVQREEVRQGLLKLFKLSEVAPRLIGFL